MKIKKTLFNKYRKPFKLLWAKYADTSNFEDLLRLVNISKSIYGRFHWKQHWLRNELIYLYIEQLESQATVDEDKIKILLKMMLEKMLGESLILPKLHNEKLRTYNTLLYWEAVGGPSVTKWEKALPEYAQIDWDTFKFVKKVVNE
eukprot:TRINITY_DN2277_c0_g3_i1.p1 TRINITY_DN2277_c0_g3~~TRINITY_DN2277_c0_g3_i1.p1  ORF type:complete len:146 (+),score=12.92 TRINITY_DN2277_c0_g3_i1:609-1046(+)